MADNYVLVVDDDPSIRDMMMDVLRSLGIPGITAENGRQALGYVDQNPPAAIILDLMMPVMDGFSMISHLQADPSTSTIPIVVMSAITDQAKIKNIPGVYGILRKGDFSLENFEAMMSRIGLLNSTA